MWLWQPKNTQKRHLLWLKPFGLCLCVHFSLLLWAFFIAHNDSHAISLSLYKHLDYSAPILFIPKTNNTQKTSKIIEQAHATPAPVKKNTSVQHEQKAPTTITQKAPDVAKEKPTISEPPKATITSPAPEIKKELQKKEEPLPTEKKIEPEEKKPFTLPENAQISHDYRKVETMRRMSLLQKELIQQWKPPIGSPADASCEISSTINSTGKITHLTIVKSSGMVMYDLSARHALFYHENASMDLRKNNYYYF